MGKELRDYQSNIVRDILNSDKDIVVCLPTGSGKTVIASALIEKLPTKVVFIVPRLELIKQAAEEFGDVDIIWSNKTSLDDKHCIVASKDSLRSQYKKLPESIKQEISEGTVIIDEAHVSLEQSYKLVNMLKPKRVIGLTATPERMDGQALLKGSDAIHKFGIFDELMQSETVASLIRKGYLSPLKYYAKPIEGISEIKPENALSEELSGKQMMEIFNDHNIWGDLIRSYEEYGHGRPALGFTTTVAMGEKVADIFCSAGYDFRVIHGEMSVKERQSLIEGLRTGKIDGLVNASLLTYGFDCPPVSYAFNCRHIKSRPLWFQIVGRILRPCEGKEDAIFVDHADSISEFSDPDCSLPILDEALAWRVDGETKEMRKKRKKAMKKVQETMALIQELDPIPAELVEITTENTWERLVRIIKRLREENASLEKEKSFLIKHVNEVVVNQKNLQNKVQEEKAKNEQLKRENEKIKKSKSKARYADKDQTFEYIRTHYIYYRRQIEESHPGIDRMQAHRMTVESIGNDESKLSFLFDQMTLERSFTYWFNNYEHKISERI